MDNNFFHEGQLALALTRCVSLRKSCHLSVNGGVGVGQLGLRFLASESHVLIRGVGSG